MLLTRSPLSPIPKERFSLDLHVLSAPPAFVLSQDQTLREVGLPVHPGKPERPASFASSLELKVSPTILLWSTGLVSSSQAEAGQEVST